MKTLTVMEPWATLIVHGYKKIETRPQGIAWKNYRGPVLIHTSKTFTEYLRQLCDQEPYKTLLKLCGVESREEFEFGHIIGAVEIWGIVSTNEFKPDEPELSLGDYNPNRIGLLLRDQSILDKPIPAKGNQGLWNFEGAGL